MKRIFFFLAFSLVGCGPNAVDDILPLDASFDLTVAREASFPDGSFDAPADTTKFNGGGPFLCAGCVCDGTIDMCYFAGGGGAPIAGDASPDDAGEDAGDDASPFGDASACPPEAGASPCTQIPVQCLPNPTCECLAEATFCACAVDPSGSGFVLTCPPKP